MTEPVVTAEMTAEEEQVLGEEVERLRERIRRLGEVNVMAIEEFEEIKKRYDYLLTEKGDLEHSIENLQEAIEHINKTSEERFKSAFEAIADRFERLFPIIFGGGQASSRWFIRKDRPIFWTPEWTFLPSLQVKRSSISACSLAERRLSPRFH